MFTPSPFSMDQSSPGPFATPQSMHHSPTNNQPKEKTQLWMGELDPWWDENTIRQIWASVGENVAGVKLIKEKNNELQTGYNAGYCFVDFGSYAAAAKAIVKNGLLIPGTSKALKLNWASGSSFQLSSSSSSSVAAAANEASIFVGDLASDVQEHDLFEIFKSRYPSVTNAKIMMDPVTGASRGYGFIRFASESDQQRALMEMNGVFVSNRPLRVSTAVPKNNVMSSNQQLLGQPSPTRQFAANNATNNQYLDPNNTTVFVGGLSNGVSEQQLRSFFQPFGDIIYVKVLNNKGCGFVQYVLRSSAETAIQQMQGYPIGNSRIRLSWGRSSVQNSQNQQKYLQQLTAPAPASLTSQMSLDYQNSYLNQNQLAAPVGIVPTAQFNSQLNTNSVAIETPLQIPNDQVRLNTLLNAARDGRLDKVETGSNGFIYA